MAGITVQASAAGAARVKRIFMVFGTRPEAVKIAPVLWRIRSSPNLLPIVVVSGQHQGMLDQMLSAFGVTPDYDLSISSPGQTPNTIVAAILERLPDLLRTSRADAVVVQGDTSTAFAAALAAFHERIPVVHLEAGLRTGNAALPFPEEANRRLIARLAQLHLAPTSQNAANLTAEGVPRSDIVITGNTVIDALVELRRTAGVIADERLAAWYQTPERIVVVTMHRRESWGAPMRAVAEAVAVLARAWRTVRFVLPLHLNSVVQDAFNPVLSGIDNVLLLPPLGYHEMIALLERAYLVLTDSGGIQEEAPSLGTPVLVLRDQTERPEAVASGTARLVGCDRDLVVKTVHRLLRDETARHRMTGPASPFGDGAAARRVVAAIGHLLGVDQRVSEFAPLSGLPFSLPPSRSSPPETAVLS